ncbi:hypothetical protein [Flavobacterium aurantiibacter]|uniref:Uncharacterized protein n=1 Tax=Flavobacterium aurantiibacter TaxID=2023067 RepID=A0A256AB56_9FLAO|nr:hypothetical protein [Flavobacterium aurantiibacter]OYQ50903.1 hypothetical protein CHX27_00590 [Flavobacterium aurantiibacter]
MKIILVCIIIYLNFEIIDKGNQGDEVTFCRFQNDDVSSLGIGVAIWNGDLDTPIKIYATNRLNRVSINFKPESEENVDACPLFQKTDYGIFHFIVTGNFKNSLRILYNKDKVGYIKKGENFEFNRWSTFLTKVVTGVRIKKGKQIFTVIKVLNEYIYVCDNKNKKLKIRWRKGEKLLIDIFLLE